MKMKKLSDFIFMLKIRHLLICFALVLPLVFTGCSQEEPDPEIVEEETKNTTSNSAKLFDGNANMLSGGVISTEYTDSPTGFGINKLVDANDNTTFSTPHNSFFILWNGSRSMVVSHYTLTSGENRLNDPKSWTLSASDNNTSWTVLDKRTDEVFSDSKGKKEYYFINKTAYKYYKLLIQSNNGGESTVLAEWTLQLKDDPRLPFSANVSDQNANMPTGGVITSQYSDSPSGSNILNIVDAKSNTKFVTYHNEFYVLWEGSKVSAVNYYALTSASDSPEKDPKSWTLSASNDLVSWTVINTQTNQLFGKREEKKEYFFENKIAYKYYKLNVLSNNGGESTQIAEWSLRGLPSDINNLMAYSSGRTLSSLTPMGKKFENRRVTTAEDRVWLATASNEPALLKSATSLTQLKEFPVTLYPYGTPMPADVNQHAIGDCSALAVFASFAYLYPDFIKDIITDNGDRTFTVAMFDPQGNPVNVTVTSKFLADSNGKIGAVTGKSDRATWSTVLEKAMMKWQNLYKVNEDIGGIGTEHAAPLFTGDGDSFAFSANKLNSEQLYRAVGVSLNQGKLVIGGFKQGGLPVSGNHKTVSAHAFTLMYSLDKTALFSMRNPWGGEGDGVLNIPDNDVIPPLIDLRIVNPGKAANYAKGIPTPYTPPFLAPSQKVIRVSEELLRTGR
jgi:hypothetical protein